MSTSNDVLLPSVKPYVPSTRRASSENEINLTPDVFSVENEEDVEFFALSLESAASRLDYNRQIGFLTQEESLAAVNQEAVLAKSELGFSDSEMDE